MPDSALRTEDLVLNKNTWSQPPGASSALVNLEVDLAVTCKRSGMKNEVGGSL